MKKNSKKNSKIKWIKWWSAENFRNGISFTGWIKKIDSNLVYAYTILLPQHIEYPEKKYGYFAIESSFSPKGNKEDLKTSKKLELEARKTANEAKKYFEQHSEWGKYSVYARVE